MTPKHQLGNRIILLSIAIVFAVASLFVQWGTITITADDLRDSMTTGGQKFAIGGMGGIGDVTRLMPSIMNGMPVALTAQSGTVNLGPLQLPYWLGIAAVVIGLAVTVTNATDLSDMPRSLIRVLCCFGVAISLWALFVMHSRGSIGIGALMLIAAAVIGFTQQSIPRAPPQNIRKTNP